MLEETEAKIASSLSDVKSKVSQRLDDATTGKSRELMQRIVLLSE